MKNIKYYLLIILALSSFVSISLFEGVVVLLLLISLYDLLKYKTFTGVLKEGISLYTFSTLFSTILYYPKRFAKAIEEGLFQFIYFLKVEKETAEKFAQIYPKILLSFSLLLIPIVIYNYFKYGDTKPFWGGSFEVGFFYALFAITSFLLFLKERGKKFSYIYLALFLLFIGIIFLTSRRSMILAFLVMFYILLFLLFKSNKLSKKMFISFNIVVFISFLSGYAYLSSKDVRFRTLNDVILGKKELNFQTLNKISSARLNLFLDGLEVIKEDIRERRFINLLIGHGIRAGEYLPHKYGFKAGRYESIFIVSEFIERGFIGLIGILMIYFSYFKRIIFFRFIENEDLYKLILAVPLGLHLVQTVFTYFWDALLPMYLLLFKISEILEDRR
ncbi:MAG TPA: O-antigen ligase domain-containing protein [Aquifex aeolicus]|nr:O-antigen ligase domain-containing protein [Aquifex aeolicus]